MSAAAKTRIIEQVIDRHDGFTIAKEQDCEEIIKAIQATGDLRRRLTNTQHSQKYLGSVPSLVAVAWAKEWGVRPFSREWLQKAKKRLLSDPNWRSLRAPQ